MSVARVTRGYDAIHDNVATKADVAELRTEVKADIAELRTEVTADIAAVRADLAVLRTELKADIAAVEQRLERQIDRMGTGSAVLSSSSPASCSPPCITGRLTAEGLRCPKRCRKLRG